jgi:hypothetical protein
MTGFYECCGGTFPESLGKYGCLCCGGENVARYREAAPEPVKKIAIIGEPSNRRK